jgi:threonine aldolase
MTKLIDLRSDTVTLPTPEMREAMAAAEVGDDVFGEDPTVNRLEALAAEKLGKEAALYVPSGTMGNLVALLTHCPRGAEVILGEQCHIFYYEVGGAATLGGLPFRLIPTDRIGYPDPALVERSIRPPQLHFPQTGVICLENSHNRLGGTVLTPEQIETIAGVAHRRGVPLHLDGARIFNAATYLGVDVRDLARPADSVMFCVSKGLSAPVGSLLTGTREFIERARRNRKMLGGGMRQAGILAAAGIVALEKMVGRLAEDHRNARRLAEGLARIPGLEVDLETVQTDIVGVQFKSQRMTPEEFVSALATQGLKILNQGNGRLRFVTHYGIESADVDEAVELIHRVLNG